MNRGNWIQTYSGKKFYPFDPQPEDIELIDIAHALSLICRFNGHCRHFYSVGQHSLNCMFVAQKKGMSPLLQLHCLLHDAAEAYIADIARPIKVSLPDINAFELLIIMTIYKKLGVLGPVLEEVNTVKRIDDRVLSKEGQDLTTNTDHWANGNADVECAMYVDTNPYTPAAIEQAFIGHVYRLLKEIRQL